MLCTSLHKACSKFCRYRTSYSKEKFSRKNFEQRLNLIKNHFVQLIPYFCKFSNLWAYFLLFTKCDFYFKFCYLRIISISLTPLLQSNWKIRNWVHPLEVEFWCFPLKLLLFDHFLITHLVRLTNAKNVNKIESN